MKCHYIVHYEANIFIPYHYYARDFKVTSYMNISQLECIYQLNFCNDLFYSHLLCIRCSIICIFVNKVCCCLICSSVSQYSYLILYKEKQSRLKYIRITVCIITEPHASLQYLCMAACLFSKTYFRIIIAC